MNQSDFNKLNAGAPKLDTGCQILAVTVNLEPICNCMSACLIAPIYQLALLQRCSFERRGHPLGRCLSLPRTSSR